ncbi:MAG TPA: hypothetical protein VH601_19565 [Bryobacteraceae bacterium]
MQRAETAPSGRPVVVIGEVVIDVKDLRIGAHEVAQHLLDVSRLRACWTTVRFGAQNDRHAQCLVRNARRVRFGICL